MTTNSPNPVDGDVRALIGLCKIEIKRWKAASETNPNMRYMVTLMETALSSLTAEPVYQFIANNPDKDGYIEWADCNPDYFSKESTDMRRILYTTPPAQLLRPVELPGGFSPAIGDIFDRQAPVMRRDRDDGCWIHKAVVAELLRSLGHEVK